MKHMSSNKSSITIKSRRKSTKPKGFVLDAHKVDIAIRNQTQEDIFRQAYTGLHDRHLQHFFQSESKKKDMFRSGLLDKRGQLNTLELPQVMYRAPYVSKGEHKKIVKKLHIPTVKKSVNSDLKSYQQRRFNNLLRRQQTDQSSINTVDQVDKALNDRFKKGQDIQGWN